VPENLRGEFSVRLKIDAPDFDVKSPETKFNVK
jgi:hypothetical protein